jgi:GxxExxY protein
VIYQRALEIEMIKKGLNFTREFQIEINYKEQPIGLRRVDFFVENEIMVELKATSTLESVHFAQAINYLEAYNLEIGLLINFGERSLKYHRITKPMKKLPEL